MRFVPAALLLALAVSAGAQQAPASAPSPEDAHRAAVRDILKLQGSFATMQTWFIEARATFDATERSIPADLLENAWHEGLAASDLPARELAVIDACAATLTPEEARASLAFLGGPDMTLINQLMRGTNDGVQTTASAFLREVDTNCCEPSATDFLMISRLKAPKVDIGEKERADLDAIFAYLDIGPISRLETMLLDEAKVRHPEAGRGFWEQDNMVRALRAHAEDMSLATSSVFVSHADRLAAALRTPEAVAHRARWVKMRAALDAQGDAVVAELVNQARQAAARHAARTAGR